MIDRRALLAAAATLATPAEADEPALGNPPAFSCRAADQALAAARL